MKKLLILVSLFLSVNVAFSQKYDKKIAASDKSIEDPKKGINPKTWISRGELFYEIAKAPAESLSAGMSEDTYNLIMSGQDVSATARKETVNETQYTVHIFEDKKVYIDNAQIKFWDILMYAAPDPMKKSYEAYMKAKNLDTGGKNAKKLKEHFSQLAILSKTEAFNKFSLNKLPEAVELFGLTIDCSTEAGEIDSLSIYYAGVIAVNAKNYPLAEKYLQKAIEIGYIEKGDAYSYLAEAMKELGKLDEARKILEKGLLSNPENQHIVISLINNYMSSGKNPKEIIPLIKQVQEKEPGNINLYIVEGDLYDKMDDMENAVKCYSKAIEVGPDDFFGYYKLGLLHYNTGAKYSKQAVDEKDNNESDRLLEIANSELKKSLPFLEKAFELNPKEITTLQALREINFRFRMEDEKFEKNAEKYKKLLESGI
jgi:tetratricopeptide (TPR) repeat protein